MLGSCYSLFGVPDPNGACLGQTKKHATPSRHSGMRRNDGDSCLSKCHSLMTPYCLIEELGIMLNVLCEAGESFGDPFRVLE